MKVFFGWILMAVGGLIALTCGLCTLSVVSIGLRAHSAPAMSTAMVALIFGAPPIAIGVGLFVAGRQLIRGPKPSKEDGDGA